MQRKFVAQSKNAPKADGQSWMDNINPQTTSGGTNEIEIDTPGNAPAISFRT
jgi:hypothetical protein